MFKCKTILKLNVQLNSNNVVIRYANYCKWAKINGYANHSKYTKLMIMTKSIDTFMLFKYKTILKLNVQLNSNNVDMRYANYCNNGYGKTN